jgi:hypothetical protein
MLSVEIQIITLFVVAVVAVVGYFKDFAAKKNILFFYLT